VAGVDEDVILALFELLEDEGSVLVVFCVMVKHPSNGELQCAKPTHKTKN